MRRDVGPHGLSLIKSFESFVGFVYDDFGPLPYREWRGGRARGTLTIGYGHTDAARDPLKISQGLRVTEPEALKILHNDLSESVEQVNRLVKVPVTQGQFDALVSFTFNCGAGNTKLLTARLNRGDYAGARAAFGNFVRSKGQVMRGLVRRRHAEQILWDQDYGGLQQKPAPTDAEQTITPRQIDPPAPRGTDRGDAGAVVAGGIGATEVIRNASDTISSVDMAHESLSSAIASIATSPGMWIALALVVGVGVLWWRYHTR